MADILRGKKPPQHLFYPINFYSIVMFGNGTTARNSQRVRGFTTCAKAVHMLLNHCGFALLVRPGWFPFPRSMSKRFSRAEREHLMCQDDVVIERGVRASGIFALEYEIMDTIRLFNKNALK